MIDKFGLSRFLTAHSNSYHRALEEIRSGRKTSHWMWYIFPQIHGLGHSSTSKKYAINSKEEAISYFNHPILGKHLSEITEVFLAIDNKTAKDILGSPDDLKLKSSMTLFDAVQSGNNLFGCVLDKYFEGDRCDKTLRNLNLV